MNEIAGLNILMKNGIVAFIVCACGGDAKSEPEEPISVIPGCPERPAPSCSQLTALEQDELTEKCTLPCRIDDAGIGGDSGVP